MELLAEPISLYFSQRKCPNRVLKAAMTERLSTIGEGKPTAALHQLYNVWGRGNLGLFHTGNIMVHRNHLEAPGCAILDRDVNAPWYVSAFQSLQEAVKRGAAEEGISPPVIVAQIAHVGGGDHPLVVNEQGNQPLAGDECPVNWSEEGIRDIIARFVYAASILHNAGLDGVQIHAAYKCFLVQFLSSSSNTRTDSYGCASIHNRARLLLNIIDEIRQHVADSQFIISVKLDSTDFQTGGLSSEDAQTLARLLESAKVDYIELSGSTQNGIDNETLRSSLRSTKLVLTGGMTSLQSMSNVIASGNGDIVGLARTLTHEPDLISRILSGRTMYAKPNKLPKGTILNLEAGIEQMHRIARGLSPLDFSDEAVVEKWSEQRKRMFTDRQRDGGF